MSRHMTIAYVSRDLFLLSRRSKRRSDQIGCSQPVMSKQIERQLIVFDFDW